MKKVLILFIAVFAIFSLQAKDNATNKNVPLNPEVKRGVLPNGITYYIMHNEEPKKRASFFIVQNVGALLENDDQNGLAHFCEHMCFNGTKNFPNKELINTLEKHGIAFGKNLNAYTSFEETMYNISDVPTEKENLLDTCLLMLNDWSCNITMSDKEIDKERGVIHEEWRTRRDADFRMFIKAMPYMFKDSKYAKRDVIGDVNIIDNFKHETLRNFYKDWYRTNLQAIVVVGDFDVAKMEKKLVALFSKNKAVKNPKERVYNDVPDNKEPIFGKVCESEATNTTIEIYYKHNSVDFKNKDKEYLRGLYINNLYKSMLSTRIQELLQKENPPFIGCFAGYDDYISRKKDCYMIYTVMKTGEEKKGLEAALVENERVKRHGFTASEFDIAKKNILKQYDSQMLQKNKIRNDNFAREYARHFLVNEPAPGVDYENQYLKEVLPTISLEEINGLAKKWITKENQIIIVKVPQKDSATTITKEETFAIFDKVAKADIKPYEDKLAGAKLLDIEPVAGKIVTEKELKQFNATELTLSNGAKVIYKFSDINKDEILFSSYSLGGTSLYKNVDDLYSAGLAHSFVDGYGIGNYDPITLNKLLAGKKIQVTPSIGGLTEGVSGNCSPSDFETFMQLIYMTFEKPRFDQSIYNSLVERYRSYLQNAQNDPDKIKGDSISLITTNYNPRTLLMGTEYFNKVSFDKIKSIYLDRMQDASDFTFFITGNYKLEDAKPLIEKYIGSIKSSNRKESFVNNNVDMPKGKTVKKIAMKLKVPKATNYIKYSAKMPYSYKNKLMLGIVKSILSIRYVESVREEKSGTYGVGVGSAFEHYPEGEASLRMSFDCDPNRVDSLKPLIYAELEKIAKNGPTQIDLDKVILNMQKERKEALNQNGFWIAAMYTFYMDDVDITSKENFDDVLNNMKPEDIKNITKEFLNKADLVDVTFTPTK